MKQIFFLLFFIFVFYSYDEPPFEDVLKYNLELMPKFDNYTYNVANFEVRKPSTSNPYYHLGAHILFVHPSVENYLDPDKDIYYYIGYGEFHAKTVRRRTHGRCPGLRELMCEGPTHIDLIHGYEILGKRTQHNTTDQENKVYLSNEIKKKLGVCLGNNDTGSVNSSLCNPTKIKFFIDVNFTLYCTYYILSGHLVNGSCEYTDHNYDVIRKRSAHGEKEFYIYPGNENSYILEPAIKEQSKNNYSLIVLSDHYIDDIKINDLRVQVSNYSIVFDDLKFEEIERQKMDKKNYKGIEKFFNPRHIIGDNHTYKYIGKLDLTNLSNGKNLLFIKTQDCFLNQNSTQQIIYKRNMLKKEFDNNGVNFYYNDELVENAKQQKIINGNEKYRADLNQNFVWFEKRIFSEGIYLFAGFFVFLGLVRFLYNRLVF